MKPEQTYADLFPDENDLALSALVQELDAAYTAPQRPDGLSWPGTSQRLTLVARSTPDAITSIQREPSRRLIARRGARWPLATAAALLLALLGIGLASPLAHWFGGSTSTPVVYAAINQSLQISNGIKLTAVKGYVDPKHLVLYYDVLVPANLNNKYRGGAFVSKSTIQGKVGYSAVVITKLEANQVYHCALAIRSNGDIAGDTLQVTWHISEIGLDAVVAGYSPLIIKGDWTLRFAIPFRHEVQDPLQFTFPGTEPVPIPEY